MEGSAYIQGLKNRRILQFSLQGLALSLGISLLAGSLLNYLFGTGYWIYFAAFILSAGIFLIAHPLWKINEQHIARYLDSHFPELEESSGLFLKPQEQLGTLEYLQTNKIRPLLPEHHIFNDLRRKNWLSIVCLGLGLASYFLIPLFPAIKNNSSNDQLETNHINIRKEEKVLPQISSYSVEITPPSYTGRSHRQQNQFYLKAELDAKVVWNIRTNKTIRNFRVFFNEVEKLQLKPLNQDSTLWSFSRKLDKQGFYQLELDGKKSDLYQIEVIPDYPVKINITQPKPQHTIDIGQPMRINIKAQLNDDYGITGAYISATMASGKGESVSFTEKRLQFDVSFANRKNIALQKSIDLRSLGMKPGDELYFFIQAQDNKGQQSRSDVYMVNIVDTAELMSMAGMTSGVNLVPEYFRSQRQIILDTEKLLGERTTISTEDFNKRSNSLAIDQKLLRLRYGKFLGEENETSIGGDNEDHDEHDGHDHGEEKFGDVQAIMDRYAHKHDIAEDATFFEPAIKAQLKAVLNEMWKSELQLRTYKPQEALPFEYKALRLLKDLQQKSRAYVAKTTIKTATLKNEKRLTGELDKIVSPRSNAQFENNDRSHEELRTLLSLLNLHRDGKAFTTNDKALLQNTERQIIVAAASHPESYLGALKSLRNLIAAKNPQAKDLEQLSKAIYQLIGTQPANPQPEIGGTAKKLSDRYFNHLRN
ncbi:DUF4175 family protein [Pedobacter sp.]|uniref:DUF4175 family protein n=1 Tax=Pedobacter sp. TaxID=1411316 RepID=UPI0031DA3525